jgi:hypothetical protein
MAVFWNVHGYFTGTYYLHHQCDDIQMITAVSTSDVLVIPDYMA